MNTRTIAAIARKDIVDAIRNRYLLTALVTPLLVMVLIHFILPGAGNKLNAFTVVVHDAGKSNLISALHKVPQLKIIEAASGDRLIDQVVESKAVAALDIPADFDAQVASDKQPQLVSYLNSQKSSVEQYAFRRILEQQVAALEKRPPAAQLIWKDTANQDVSPAKDLNLDQTLLILLLVMSLAMTGTLVTPLLLVEEKEKRTLDFLLTSPSGLPEIIIGKALTALLYSVLVAGIVLAFEHKQVASWTLTSLTIGVGMVLLISIGLLMGSFFNNTMQVNTWAGLIVFLLLLPTFVSLSMPAAIQPLTRLIPTTYFVEALKLSLTGTASMRLFANLGAVSGYTLVALFAAVWTLGRRQS